MNTCCFHRFCELKRREKSLFEAKFQMYRSIQKDLLLANDTRVILVEGESKNRECKLNSTRNYVRIFFVRQMNLSHLNRKSLNFPSITSMRAYPFTPIMNGKRCPPHLTDQRSNQSQSRKTHREENEEGCASEWEGGGRANEKLVITQKRGVGNLLINRSRSGSESLPQFRSRSHRFFRLTPCRFITRVDRETPY